MSDLNLYEFSVPVRGTEEFSVMASSFEEAMEKVSRGEYFDEPVLEDVDWDTMAAFGGSSEYMKCYCVVDGKEVE